MALVALVAFGLMAVGLVGVGSGCATWVNYPAIGKDAAINDPNIAPTPTVIERAVERVVSQTPLDRRYALNLPREMELERAERIANSLLESLGRGVVLPGEEGWRAAPMFHVTRVWVRGDGAEVDVLRPEEAGAHQRVTVTLERTWGAWGVTRTREWPVGLEEPPAVYLWETAEPVSEGEPQSEGAHEDRPEAEGEV